MILMIRPGGGSTYVHESRADEYLARGFSIPAPVRAPEPEPEKRPATKKTKKKG